MTEARPNEISTGTAATLLGVSFEMFRRVAKAGHILIHRRGFTTVEAAVGGYAAFLREDAKRAEANASAVRAHNAKAATTAAANARRRSGLADRAEVEDVVNGIAAVAIARLRAADLSSRLPAGTVAVLKREIAAACVGIEKSRDAALRVLRGEGGSDDE